MGVCEAPKGTAKRERGTKNTTTCSFNLGGLLKEGGEGAVASRLKDTGRVSPFLTCPPFWRVAQVVRYNPKAAAKRRNKAEICFKHSRGGPIAEQTTGDRKEKIGDHKEDLRQKPHDRRRQSTYLHAVPESRCPSSAGP